VEWGEALYDTLKGKLGDLPPETVVLPAHYGSAAEIGVEGVVSGRLGELREAVPEMRIASAREFVAAVRKAVKDPPAAYKEIIQVNLGTEASPEKISEWELGKNQCAASARKAAEA
jgi:hypothetical protein